MNSYPIDVLDGSAPHADIRIYAGQSDPPDPSHFMIRYEAAGQTGTVDGRVDNQGHLSLARNKGGP